MSSSVTYHSEDRGGDAAEAPGPSLEDLLNYPGCAARQGRFVSTDSMTEEDRGSATMSWRGQLCGSLGRRLATSCRLPNAALRNESSRRLASRAREVRKKLDELVRLNFHTCGSWSPTGLPNLQIVSADPQDVRTASRIRELSPPTSLRPQSAREIRSRASTSVAVFLDRTAPSLSIYFIRRAPRRNNGVRYAIRWNPDIGTVVRTVADAREHHFGAADGRAAVARATPEIVDALIRLIQNSEQPQHAPMLSPLYERELLFRILQSPVGWSLFALFPSDSAHARAQMVAKWIESNYARPLRLSELGKFVSATPAVLHRSFRELFGTSPLNYQKQTRLIQARTLLATGRGPAKDIARFVGYRSETQFSRDYASKFGLPPNRDIARLRRSCGC